MISNALEDFPDSPEFLSMWLAIESQTVGIQKQSSLKISKNRNGSSLGSPRSILNDSLRVAAKASSFGNGFEPRKVHWNSYFWFYMTLNVRSDYRCIRQIIRKFFNLVFIIEFEQNLKKWLLIFHNVLLDGECILHLKWNLEINHFMKIFSIEPQEIFKIIVTQYFLLRNMG